MTTTAVWALAWAAAVAAGSEPVVLKVGTMAPAGSAWHESLRDLSRRWEEASAGRVRLRVYAGGTQGNEGDMLRKVGVGQLHVAAVSNVGLHALLPEAQAFSVPLLFHDDAEVACALASVRRSLDEAAAARGLVVVQWTRLGRASFFCSAPVRTPEEAAALRTFAWEDDPGTVKAWRAAGFQPVVLATTDLVPALSTRMIDCVGQLPLYMLATRAFERARHVVDLPWGFVLGATVMRRETWERLPPDVRPALLAAAAEVGERIGAEGLRLEQEAMDAMARGGLSVVAVSAPRWRAALERAWPVLRGEVVPAPFFDAVVAARDACRAPERRRLTGDRTDLPSATPVASRR